MEKLPKNRSLSRKEAEGIQKLLYRNMTCEARSNPGICNCDLSEIADYGAQILKPCPFCGSGDLHFDSITNDIGTEIPIIFCNLCKAEFHVENDSPYMDDNLTKIYLHKKNIEVWNRRA